MCYEMSLNFQTGILVKKKAIRKYQFGIPKSTNRTREKGTNEHNKGMLMSKISQRGTNRAQQGGANKHQ
jgi:hypothetical protein